MPYGRPVVVCRQTMMMMLMHVVMHMQDTGVQAMSQLNHMSVLTGGPG
jgi:hypothetical protein